MVRAVFRMLETDFDRIEHNVSDVVCGFPPIIISILSLSPLPSSAFTRLSISLNRLTSPHRDRYVKSPDYKVTAMQIEKEGAV
jgi:hypothetical protein